MKLNKGISGIPTIINMIEIGDCFCYQNKILLKTGNSYEHDYQWCVNIETGDLSYYKISTIVLPVKIEANIIREESKSHE